MDASILPNRPDVVSATSAPRPTAAPPRVSFSEVLAQGANTLVKGADQAVSVLPGAPLMAVALRGTASASSSLVSTLATSVGSGSSLGGTSGASYVAASPSVSPEGPTASGTATGTTGSGTTATGTTSTTDPTGMQGTLQQSQEMNIYYLQLQEQVNQQNRTYSALSDVLKAEHDTVKTAIGNIH